MKTLFTLLACLISSHLLAAILYVKPEATGTGDGSSWANASGDLQAMINLANPTKDEVWVATGRYFPRSYPSGCLTCGTASPKNRNNTFLLKSGLRMYGGFAGTETARYPRNSHLNETILSGDLGEANETSDNTYHVVTAIDCDINTVLERFTIKSGNANDPTSATVAGRTYYRSWGGGVLSVYSSIKIVSCAIVENQATYGGGILNSASSPYVSNSVIVQNNANEGGGIYNHEGSTAYIANCTIVRNTANTAGGAMYNYNSNPTIINAIIWYNNSPMYSTIFNNGSTLTGYSSNVKPGWTGGTCTNCLSGYVEPHFTNLDFPAGIDGRWGSRDDGLRITACSPGKDQGTQGYGFLTESVDMANQPREVDIPDIPDATINCSLDMGAYEYQNTATSNQTFYVNGSLTTGLNDGSSWANAFRGANAFGYALRHANNCDGNTILVAKGTYKPDAIPVWFLGNNTNRNYTFDLKSDLRIYGGFLGTGSEALSDYSGYKARQNETILSGDFLDNDIVTGEGGTLSITNNTENAHHVLTAIHVGGIQLYGFTIKGGNAVGAASPNGGGVLGDESVIGIFDCNIKHNMAEKGAGIYFDLAGSTYFSNVFNIVNSFFDQNLATNDGGAIYRTYAGHLVVKNNVFVGNRAALGEGGAIRNVLGPAQFYNNTFYNNSAQTTGGALHFFDPHIAGAFIELCKAYNNIFYKNAIGTNTASTYADFYITWGNGREFKNNILQFASSQYPTDNASSSSIGPTAANNLFAVNPLFANETNLLGSDIIGGTADDGLRLQRTSPAINVGFNGIGIPSNDILGNSRYSYPDIGAYDFQPKEFCPDVRYVGDVPIEAGRYYAGTTFYSFSSVPEPTKNQRVGSSEATMAVGDGHITSDGTVATATSVVFDAKNSIILLPGFETETGAVFKTNLQGCIYSVIGPIGVSKSK